ncbi:GSCFA domain-containing protein [Pararhizobium sp.]|uniref:GSCFA domain-containing protein n=1 Tax=Pararhizobium sp. TaxID=1977563 RepID=UPI003D119B40
MNEHPKHPFIDLPRRAFWKSGVAEPNMFEISDLWTPKLEILPTTRVVTFGSCFAQHIGRALKKRGYGWLSTEPAPPGLSPQNAKKYSYDVFSARTGNIYTTSMLRQWVEWASGIKATPTETWQRAGRFYDPFRPSIEKDGFASVEECLRAREFTLTTFRKAIEEADIFVFTLGLTESWYNCVDGYEYAVCPGTVAGKFDPQKHVFKNQDYAFILNNLTAAIEMMRDINPHIRVLLTVSPVPLTATKTDRHVVVATMASKSVLRAVADYAANSWDSGARIVPIREIEGDLSDWQMSGSVSSSEGVISISGPSSNPFSGIKRRLEKLGRSDAVVLGFDVETESSLKLSISISPAPATRRNGKTVVQEIEGRGRVDLELKAGWDGELCLWIGAGAEVGQFHISNFSCIVQTIAQPAQIDYFPSYEIINSPVFGGVFFEANKREVSQFGVDFVMSHFFAGLSPVAPVVPKGHTPATKKEKTEMDVICDESLLEAFAGVKA